MSEEALDTVLAYHQITKHALNRFADGPGYLDWTIQPDPFRRYSGARLISLRQRPPDETIAPVAGPGVAAPLGLDSISQFFFDSLALSAWKEYGGSRWALRVNPSSGNLHPTEGYLICGPVPGLCDAAMVAHYAPKEHGLEVRAEVPAVLWQALAMHLPADSFLIGLTSIYWREAWKYGQRAYRYCQHDVGHALAAISIAAAVLGWQARLLNDPSTEQISYLLGVADQNGPEAEHADCLVLICTRPTDRLPDHLPQAVKEAFRDLTWHGTPNVISPQHVTWEWVDAAVAATRKPATQHAPAAAHGAHPAVPTADGQSASSSASLRRLIRQRRSAVAMDGQTHIGREACYRMMAQTLPGLNAVPFGMLPWRPRVSLAVFVHRVTGLEPGLYLLVRDRMHLAGLRSALKPAFAWRSSTGCPTDLPFYQLQTGDMRRIAQRVSCDQEIAADGCFSLGMVAEFEQPLAELGAWFYPRLFWECGMIGQALYLAAEAIGLRGTGIGCFSDDAMHGLLGLWDRRFQSLYHFTVGGAVEDTRLTTLPAYE